LLDFAAHLSAEEKTHWTHFVMRFQQLTAPLMAKGFEDTTLYVYNRLLSLNDVGGEPDRFGVTVDEFHDFIQRRKDHWPHAMNTTATHDTKRGEDARARINVLSELPDEWDECLKTWSKINRGKKTKIKGKAAPDRNDEYFLYQTLIGSYPVGEGGQGDFLERLRAYLVKAVREAKVHTEWLKPDLAYEEAFTNFATALLVPAENNRFLSEFVPFAQKIAQCGMYNSLGQTLLKLAVPGVADIYQGTELWDLSFVDPDNRRAVDYAARVGWLEELKSAESKDRLLLIQDLLAHWEDGRIKLYLMSKLLGFRRLHRELFAAGDYIPLKAAGEMGERVCAFGRRRGSVWALAIVPRLVGQAAYRGRAPLGEELWGSTALNLPAQTPLRWLDVISGQPLEAAPSPSANILLLRHVFKHFPVALLHHEETMDRSLAVEENAHGTIIQHTA
jgi:(1->4)-alpha-D-glucan 1-alpha-D-glucosylmutase